MKIRTLWEQGLNTEMPWLVAAVDEYSIEACDGLPESYQEELKRHSDIRREMIIEVADSVVEKLFRIPEYQAMKAEKV